MVLRIPYGGGIHAPEHHSESIEAMFAHIPGLRVVVASTPAKAYGYLRAAIASPDPVVFLEPKKLYQTEQPDEAIGNTALSLDSADIVRQGDNISLFAWGAMIPLCEAVAADLSEQGIDIEVVDVACLSVLDMPTISASVEKTGRCVIVHEAARNGGFGAEISARISELHILSLRAPIVRVTGYDTVMPYAKLEDHFMPDQSRITQACYNVMDYQ